MRDSHTVTDDDDDVLGILEVVRSCDCCRKSLLQFGSHVCDFGLEISLKDCIGNSDCAFIL